MQFIILSLLSFSVLTAPIPQSNDDIAIIAGGIAGGVLFGGIACRFGSASCAKMLTATGSAMKTTATNPLKAAKNTVSYFKNERAPAVSAVKPEVGMAGPSIITDASFVPISIPRAASFERGSAISKFKSSSVDEMDFEHAFAGLQAEAKTDSARNVVIASV